MPGNGQPWGGVYIGSAALVAAASIAAGAAFAAGAGAAAGTASMTICFKGVVRLFYKRSEYFSHII